MLIFLSGTGLFAWTDHTLGTYPALANMPEVKDSKPVQVESFEDFLKESQGLAVLMKEQEDFARANIQNYPPKPDSILFDPNDKQNIRKKFLNGDEIKSKHTSCLLYPRITWDKCF